MWLVVSWQCMYAAGRFSRMERANGLSGMVDVRLIVSRCCVYAVGCLAYGEKAGRLGGLVVTNALP